MTDSYNQKNINLEPEVAPTIEIFLAATDYGANRGDFRVRAQGNTGTFRYTFNVPPDFDSLVSLELIAIPQFTSVASNIDLFSDYGALGELFTTHSEADTTSTFPFTLDTLTAVDISSVFSSLSAGDFCGMFFDHKAVGGTVDYLGIKMVYIAS